MREKSKDLALLTTGVVEVLPGRDLEKKLATGKKLKIKLGMDPTAPDLHLGHAIVLSKLKQFQDLGHEIIFLIGDFTARIGDPTGKSRVRPPLSEEEIVHNTRTYFEQVGKILDTENISIVYNAKWLDSLTSKEMMQLCAKVTLARLIERDDFAKRIAKREAIGFHELFYPLMQAYDSVILHADVELGGTDQTFNLLMGRFLQEQYGQKAQVIMTMPLLLGLDGVHKMSKSLNNAIGLTEDPRQVFGKLMSISDELMWHYFELLVGSTAEQLSQMQERVAAGTLHPMGLKKDMAHAIILKFWSSQEAIKAREAFEAVFQRKDYSKAQKVNIPDQFANPVWIVELIKTLSGIKSSSEIKRLLEANAISVDGKKVTDFKAEITWKSGMIVKIGKHKIYQLR